MQKKTLNQFYIQSSNNALVQRHSMDFPWQGIT